MLVTQVAVQYSHEHRGESAPDCEQPSRGLQAGARRFGLNADTNQQTVIGRANSANCVLGKEFREGKERQ